MVVTLVRPDRGKRAYRLRCRFQIDAFPKASFLEKAKYAAAEAFVRDMAKRGWQHVEKYGFRMTGPFPATVTVNLPKRSQQMPWAIPSRDLLPAIQAGYRFGPRESSSPYISEVPLLGETDRWEYELAGVFVHETILTESPDEHELKEEERKR